MRLESNRTHQLNRLHRVTMFDVYEIVAMHDGDTHAWHAPAKLDQPDHAPSQSLHHIAERQHRANFDLWHEEDKARSPEASCADITEVKHIIDRLNQQRNDLVEQMDCMLLTAAGDQNHTAPLHSETPGMIVDRLSILALKIYHTAEEVNRPGATDAHHQRNQQRLQTLTSQRDDLATCLHDLWQQILDGKRRFKLYRQMKMYNDPELNPVLYQGSRSGPC